MTTLFATAQTLMPGGVNSPVRAFQSVGGEPLYITGAEGAYLNDASNRQFIDYVGGFGPMILGHSHPEVVRAIQEQAAQGLTYGTCNPLEVELATLITSIMPSIEMLRMVNSGTEAAMTAVRLARAATKRPKIIKLTGCYHGHTDALLVAAGSGATTLGIPSSPGIPDAVTQDTLCIPFNDADALQKCFQSHGRDIAAVLLEPICGNMGLITPQPGFLETCQALCQQYDSLLVFDEVMTGFRVALGGAQSLYGIQPDITILGKIIGGGLPVGALGGRRELMEMLAPVGPVYQAGTLSGNHLTMAAGLATLKICQAKSLALYSHLNVYTKALCDYMQTTAQRLNIPIQLQSVGGMFGFFFSDSPVQCYEQACQSDTKRFAQFFQSMLAQGVYLPPSAYEACFVSGAHGDVELRHTCDAIQQAMAAL
jgi:glutamate-1-semialdehyde 2,1-aminomutase